MQATLSTILFEEMNSASGRRESTRSGGGGDSGGEQLLRVPVEVLAEERGHEEEAVPVARLPAQRQSHARVARARRLEHLRPQLALPVHFPFVRIACMCTTLANCTTAYCTGFLLASKCAEVKNQREA